MPQNDASDEAAYRDTIKLSPAMAAALTRIGIGDFRTVDQPERMAWVVLVLRELEDRDEWFPHGKWATIQHLEMQLIECAETVARIVADGKGAK